MSSVQHQAGDFAECDIIFAGGGTAACVAAGRLAAADPSLKIAILEAGPHTREIQEHIQPGRYFSHLTLPGETFTFHKAKPSDALAGRSVVVPAGRCLGGGSSVNFAMYTRAAASDYDDWEVVHKNPGWGSKHLIPLLKKYRPTSKAETYQPGTKPGNDTHGDSGPIKVSHGDDDVNIGSQFLDVAGAYDKERTSTDDVNDFYSCNVYGKWPKGVRAVGVEYVNDMASRAKGVTKPTIIKALRLVVLSAGTFGSPAVLERSGIGASRVLQKCNIQQLVDLPGVGEHYMDHNVIFAPYFASEDADSLDILFRGSPAEVSPHAEKWLAGGKGLMAHNGLDSGIKIRPNAEDLKEIGPAFENDGKIISQTRLTSPYAGMNPAAPRRKYFSVGYYAGYPVSVGRVHISSVDPYTPLDFEPGYLDDPVDLGVLRWAYKKGREFARRMAVYRGEFDLAHPLFPSGSAAASTISDGPVEISAPDIAYSKEDDDAIDQYHRQFVETSWHSLGTCAMKPRDQGGVVDPKLNVYDTQGLKVADCSIAPANVGSNTYNTALAIGEKAAVIIAEELGICGV
ncbi:hypothetical protein BD779DRAFT_1668010 [Infundibulicybe gibba]|nr:hypothetical protein BD779DRAFT_1668010 [Infundibulicybe gibba]